MLALLVGLFALVFSCNVAVSAAYMKKGEAVVSLVIAVALIFILRYALEKPL